MKQSISQKTIIKVNDLNKTFKVRSAKVPVLKEINLKVEAGEFIIITGPSGCGKSTLLHILLGLETPTTGSVKLLGQELYRGMNEDARTQIRKNDIGMVYQQPNWLKAMTVLENIMFTLRINGQSNNEARKKSLEVLQMVGMSNWYDYTPSELSSGQRQKIAVARAVVNNPKIIIADEPTGNLDFRSGQELMGLLKKLNRDGKTVIMVTHDLEYMSFASRLLIMFDGKIVGEAHEDELSGKISGFKKLIDSVIPESKEEQL